ncbi:MAG: hypothetical protein B1H11_06370 [Desulfobacteraceae bacterium 4484_190.1]|nr:MAG: hypothetical protein B1H11_06370 [Desulfobacteraceae bacterium 4484_190.1]
MNNSDTLDKIRYGKKVQIGDNVKLRGKIDLGDHVKISDNVIIYPNVIIKDNSYISPGCIIGEPTEDYYRNNDHPFKPTIIGNGSIIRSGTIIYEDNTLGDNLQTGHNAIIREGSKIGNKCNIGSFTELQPNVYIGNYVRIHSKVMVGELTRIEDFVWIYPHVKITNDRYPPHRDFKTVTIKKYSQIGAGSLILPGIEIGENAIVGAMTVVKRDVKPERVISGVPGRDICSIRDLKDEQGNMIYPWKDHLKDYRGYPWQETE